MPNEWKHGDRCMTTIEIDGKEYDVCGHIELVGSLGVSMTIPINVKNPDYAPGHVVPGGPWVRQLIRVQLRFDQIRPMEGIHA